ncbi:cytochrome c4 [Janthinobacterium sp. HH103]|uniref:Cytochrome c4 n=1 Tax=Janthinobacterium agaricidamnosum TaxID=55508 RepID=A0A3G2E318_9BURK|nr:MULTISPECIES: c-type cytochrome [Janthinobacterium]AYM74414.1 cytochrome c4 [Janthinobacterium agaricidamnosum]OEZ67637.1 cytochrome c4 [Janthinobacterium sp. HH100]OEZ74488.1 cytochrome c4 [Janthinobacterium sp. HH103]OEZ79865.1 cytochrome c4 [Janthinobacterium sp. HH106]OEZ95080.1 cytochrome c4 [Janthinobacterium sp. HH107]
MNRAFSPLFKSMLLALLAVSATASAVEAPKPAVKADAAKGATLYADGDAARGLPACVSCHGAAGNSTITVNPKLAGQHESYIYKQLVDFTTPERNQPVMTTYAKMLSDADKKNIAAYLGAQLSKPGAAKNKDTIDLGKKIYRGGIASKQVAACASCHGATGNGIPVQYPRIAGQHQDYTVAQLTMFRSTKADARKNSAQMHTIAARMSDDEIAAVADYIAGLK